MHLDEKLNFNHVKKIAKASRGIGLIHKLAHVLRRQSLLTIYKSFIKPNLDYSDIIYDQPNNESFCNLAHVLHRQSLLTIYKSFIKPNLDYSDIIYDQPNNESFCNLIEKVQYNAALAITGAIKGTSQLKIYNELGIESLKFRRWFRRLCVFLKLKLPKFQSIYMNLFCLHHIFIALVTQKMLELIIAELISSNTLFFHIL